MRWARFVIVILGLALFALPVSGAIKAMDLHEFMGITIDTVHGTIVGKTTFLSDYPEGGTWYTRLTIEGESVRHGGERRTSSVLFMGSHDPRDDFYHSEAPRLSDVRLGNEVLVFFGHQPELDQERGGADVIWSHGGVYRIERGFGQPVVIGLGDGFAFPENIGLADAKRRIGETHKLILAERAAADKAEK